MADILVYVEFYDHFSLPADWFSLEDVLRVRTVQASGFLIKETPQMIYLSSISDSESELESGGVAIIKKCIKTIRKIKISDFNSPSK